MDISQFTNKESLFKYLKDNKNLLITEKKSAMKKADATLFINTDNEIERKSIKDTENTINTIKVSVVVNSCNILDSHGDVHITGIWNKTLKEQRNLYLLQEHKMTFDNIITDNLTASVKMLKWSSLGLPDFVGSTQCLIFDAIIDRERNEKMFTNYFKGYVKNHSVGMQYVTLFLCINSNDKIYSEEKSNWDKYSEGIVNIDKAKEQGFFWAVTESKLIEGSAVPIGSNYATPTLSIESKNIEADIITSQIEPLQDTQIKQTIDYNYLLNNLKNK